MSIPYTYEFVATLPGNGVTFLWLYENEIIDREPVLGFLVYRDKVLAAEDYYFIVMPVTAETVHDGDTQRYAFLRPDGSVDLPEERSFASEDEFRDYLARQKAKVA